jgi:hypothetical protein
MGMCQIHNEAFNSIKSIFEPVHASDNSFFKVIRNYIANCLLLYTFTRDNIFSIKPKPDIILNYKNHARQKHSIGHHFKNLKHHLSLLMKAATLE